MTTALKYKRAFALAGIPEMPMTRAHILRNIEASTPAAVLAGMSSKHLAAVICAANASYHDGRGSAAVDADCVWIGDKLLPSAALRAVEVTESYEPYQPPNSVAPSRRDWKVTRYSLNYSERT